MSKTDDTTRERRDQTSTAERERLGAIRRMAVNLTSGSFWRVLGHLLFGNVREQHDAEVFSGIGFYARPKAGANAEAIVAFVGGASNPIIIATRDEDARKAIAQLDDDSTAMFNTATIIVIKPDGTVEIRTAAGVAHPLPTLDEFNAHTHPAPGGATSAPTTPATGTAVLKAQ